MKIKILNPNTSKDMTNNIKQIALNCSSEKTDIICKTAKKGPKSIETFSEESIATVEVMDLIKTDKNKVDAYLIACFGDPGLYEAREITDVPVMGVGEASILMAALLGYKFSIITILRRTIAAVGEQLERIGMKKRCASIKYTEEGVLDIEENKNQAKESLVSLSKEAIEEDGAEVICLGCAGMSGMDKEIEKVTGAPTIDPVVAGVKITEAVIGSGKTTSKINTFK